MAVNIDYNYSDDVPPEIVPNSSFGSALKRGMEINDGAGKGLFAMRLRAGARTITKGGWNPNADAAFDEAGGGAGGMAKRWFKENHHPRSLIRGPTQLEFDPRKSMIFNKPFFKEGKTGLSMAEQETTKLGQKLIDAGKYNPATGEYGSAIGKFARATGVLNQGNLQHLVDPKFLGRISAAADYSRMGTLTGEQAGNLTTFVRHAGAEKMANALEEQAGKRGVFEVGSEGAASTVEAAGGGISGDLAAQATRLSMQGSWTGGIAGYLQSAAGKEVDPLLKGTLSAGVERGLGLGVKSAATRKIFDEAGFKAAATAKQAGYNVAKEAAGGAGEKVVEGVAATAAKEAGEAVVDEGVKYGLKAAAGTVADLAGTFAAEAAGSAAFGGLNVAMDAMAIYTGAKLVMQLGKLAFDVAGHEIKSELKSFNGQIRKDPMGMGYHDTAAAATSRSRGVMAISNSRLNARSILGSEAGMMAAHFG